MKTFPLVWAGVYPHLFCLFQIKTINCLKHNNSKYFRMIYMCINPSSFEGERRRKGAKATFSRKRNVAKCKYMHKVKSEHIWGSKICFCDARGESLALKFQSTNYQQIIFSIIDDIRSCLLYTSDAADERSSVDLGGRRIIQKKNKKHKKKMKQEKNTNKNSWRRG